MNLNSNTDLRTPSSLTHVATSAREAVPTSSGRRRFFQRGAAAAMVATLATPVLAQTAPTVRWRLASSFPKSLDTIYGGAEVLSKRLHEITAGKFQVSVHAAGELMPAFGVVDALQNGGIECAHTASYYFVGKNKTFGFETTLPFGLNQRQQNAWMYYGGGLQLVRDFLREYNIVSFPGGNTGVQMGGWFKREIKTLADLKGLKMRIPGIGGEVMARLGVVPQQIAGGEIYQALEKGTIDAAEWVGPYDDEKLGFYKVASHYYYPGWWESNSMYSFYINSKAWDALPKDYQAAFAAAAAEANIDMMAEYDFKNPTALRRLVGNGVKLHAYSIEIMKAAQEAAFDLYAEEAEKNPSFRKIYDSWQKFRSEIMLWHRFAEQTYANFVLNNPVRR